MWLLQLGLYSMLFYCKASPKHKRRGDEIFFIYICMEYVRRVLLEWCSTVGETYGLWCFRGLLTLLRISTIRAGLYGVPRILCGSLHDLHSVLQSLCMVPMVFHRACA